MPVVHLLLPFAQANLRPLISSSVRHKKLHAAKFFQLEEGGIVVGIVDEVQLNAAVVEDMIAHVPWEKRVKYQFAVTRVRFDDRGQLDVRPAVTLDAVPLLEQVRGVASASRGIRGRGKLVPACRADGLK